ncbi:MAG: Uncharacterized conserved protein YgbK, DUF1537 family [Chloroflexi bacterium]|nr:MAG: Uncharacterized conserved protein YgbK, DUF1537 family [Chloroflexota bacterium]
MPDPPLLMLADDLTGALDCAAAFAARGHTTFVSTSGQIGAVNAQVIALNAGSRPQPPAQATHAIRAGLRAARDSGASLRFVKIDSTLRGHPGLEIGVAADAAAATLVIVTPAFPDNGRTVAQAQLLIDGVPLVRTEVGADPLSHVASSDVAVVLRQHTDAPVVTMPLATIRSPALATTLADLLPSNAGSRPTIVSCDAVTNADLDRLIAAGQAIAPPSGPVLFAGSAGLAAALARATAPNHREVPDRPPPAPIRAGPIILVSASQRTLADRQVTALVEHHLVELHRVEIQRDGRESAVGRAQRRLAATALSAGRSIALRSTVPGDTAALAPAEMRVLADAIARQLAAHVAALATEARIGGLVIIGGDTAFAVLSAVQASGIVLHDEPLPGVPLGTISGGVLSGLPIATKAGAFGDDQTLIRLFTHLRPGATPS